MGRFVAPTVRGRIWLRRPDRYQTACLSRSQAADARAREGVVLPEGRGLHRVVVGIVRRRWHPYDQHCAVGGHRRPADRRYPKNESATVSDVWRRQSGATDWQRGPWRCERTAHGPRTRPDERAADVLTRRSSTESSRLSGARSSRRPSPVARKSGPATSGKEMWRGRHAVTTRLGFMPPRPILRGSAFPPARPDRLRSRAKSLPACPARQVLRASVR